MRVENLEMKTCSFVVSHKEDVNYFEFSSHIVNTHIKQSKVDTLSSTTGRGPQYIFFIS